MSKIRHDTVTRVVTLDDTEQDPHRCLAGERCRAPETLDDGRHPARTEKPDSVCRRCYSAIRLAVEDLPQDHTDLLEAIGEHQHIPGEKVHGSGDAHTSPLDLIKHDLARDITTQMRIAAQRVHTARGTKGDPPRTITECSQLVSKHLQLLITSPPQLEEEWIGRGESVYIAGRYRAPTRTVQRTGIDTALRLVELRKKARSRLSGVTTKMYQLPASLPGCAECGERLYTNGNKVVCRFCDRDWTAENGGMLTREIEERHELERQRRMEELQAQLDAVTAERDQAWARLDRAATLAEAVDQPEFGQITTHQFGELLAEIIDGHPTPEQRQTASETTE